MPFINFHRFHMSEPTNHHHDNDFNGMPELMLPELRCQYPSKRCNNMRTAKRGGGLHRLCALHRARANKNQWLVDQRRRVRREHEDAQERKDHYERNTPFRGKVPTLLPEQESSVECVEELTYASPTDSEDLKFLLALFFDESDSELSDDGVLSDVECST